MKRIVVFLLIAVAVALVARVGVWLRNEFPTRTAANAPTGTSVISGSVVDTDGHPLSGVTIDGGDDAQGVRRTAGSDDAGRFTLTGLPEGVYQVLASKPGFLPTYYGERHPDAGWVMTAELVRVGPTEIPLADGQEIADIKLKMARTAALAGTVLNQQGAPAAGWQVRAMRLDRRPDNERQTMAAPFGTTDSQGRFRIDGLSPGEYIVRARHGAAFNTSVYYPAATAMPAAAKIRLKPGDERLEIHLHARSVVTAKVHGLVIHGDGLPAPKARVDLVEMTSLEPDPRRHTTTTRDDGSFEFEDIPGGFYSIVSTADVGGARARRFWASTDIVSNGRQPARVNLTLRSGRRMTGHTSIDRRTTAQPPTLEGLTVFLKPADLRTEIIAPTGTPGVKVNATGDFTIDDVPDGTYVLQMSLQRPWTLETVAAGGRPLPDARVDLASLEDLGALELTVTDRLNTLTGVVGDKQGNPRSYGVVVAFGADPVTRAARRRTRAVRTGTDGTYTLGSLPSGEYFVAVADDSELSLWFTPEFFERLTPAATRVTVASGETRTLDITVPR